MNADTTTFYDVASFWRFLSGKPLEGVIVRCIYAKGSLGRLRNGAEYRIDASMPGLYGMTSLWSDEWGDWFDADRFVPADPDGLIDYFGSSP